MRKFAFGKRVTGETWDDYYKELANYIIEYFGELAEELSKEPSGK